MNRSGAALAPLAASGTLDPAVDLLVLVDEVALPLGRFRLRAKGSAGGHNGLKSIEGTLHSQDYARLRIGVGPLPPEYDDMADFVLEPFLRDEAPVLRQLLLPMTDAVSCWVADGIETAMNRFNPIGSGKREPDSGDPAA
jgi:PTH1 family peptidyl-tRNA hydrolase